jgi:Mrp family chromosome partitioning ATPase/capsular polysaccharide biosynthesis protein
MNRAKQQLGLDKLPDYTVTIIPQTELLQISVQDKDPEHAALVANTLVQLLIEQNQNSYISDDNRLRVLLRQRLDELRGQISNLVSERDAVVQQRWLFSERLGDITQELASLGQAYNAALDTYNRTIASQSVMASAITVIEPALPPDEPLPSYFARNLILAGIAGLIGGLALAFLLESRSARFYTQRQIETITQTPIIGRIPHLKRRYRRNVFEGDRMGTDAFRRLRTYILSRAYRKPLWSLVVTSALPGEGKSIVAANLAASMAYNGLHVLLVDSNLAQSNHTPIIPLQPVQKSHQTGRKTRVAKTVRVKSVTAASTQPAAPQIVKVDSREDPDSLNPQTSVTTHQEQPGSRQSDAKAGKSGLSQILQGLGNPRDAIQESEIPNLRVLLAGTKANNSTELLSSDNFRNLLQHLQTEYDVIVFDTPAILSAADAPIIAQKTDGVLWVVNPSIASQKAVAYTRDQLEFVGANIVGIVLNNISDKDVFQPSYFGEIAAEREASYSIHAPNGAHLSPDYQSDIPSSVHQNGTEKQLVE